MRLSIKGQLGDFFRTADFTDWLLIICLFVGVLGGILTIWTWDLGWDGSTYAYMAENFRLHGEFVDTMTIEVGETGIPYIFTDGYSHHYPPLYPLYLSAFFAVFGFSVIVTKVASVVSSLLLLVVIYFTTKNLYGSKKALIVTSVSSVLFSYFFITVAIFFVLTIWAILKSLEQGQYIILAGLFAGLGYLTKSSVGYFFIVAGFGGLAWRFYYMRWKVFRDKYYLAAIVVFLSIVAAWALRNIARFGSWETSAYVSFVSSNALSNLGSVLLELVVQFGVYLLVLFVVAIYWMPQLRKTISKVKDEHYSGLWLAVGLIAIIGAIFAAMFQIWEHQSRFTPPVARYSMIAVTPLLWLIVKDTNFDGKSRITEIFRNIKNGLKKRRGLLRFLLMLLFALVVYAVLDFREGGMVFLFAAFALFQKTPRQILTVMLIGFLVASVNAATQVKHNSYVPIGEDLTGLVNDGDTIALDLVNETNFIHYDLFQATRGKSVAIIAWNASTNASFIISDSSPTHPGYELVGQYKWEGHAGVVNSLYYSLNKFVREELLSQQLESGDAVYLYLLQKEG